jgi:hypothetical protein
MTMFPAEDDAGDERLPDADAEPSLPTEATAPLPASEEITALPAAEPSLPADAVAPPRNPARSSFGDAFATLHDDGPQRHGAALRYSVELLAYYYAAQGRRNPAQEAIRTLVTDRFDILDTPQFGLYAPKGQGAAVADAGLRIMDALNAESVADPVWAGGANSTEAQRRADYAEQARGGRWVMDITGRHAILRDAQGRSVLAGSNISRVRLKGVPVVGFVMNQADQVQPLGDARVGRAERMTVAYQPIYGGPARPLAGDSEEPSGESDQPTGDPPENQQVAQNSSPAAPPLNASRNIVKPEWLTEENVHAMASVLTAETSSFHYPAGPTAVGWTILNRMSRNNVNEVARLAPKYARPKPPLPKMIELSRRLLSGEIPDNTGGATHFYSPKRSCL